MRRLANLMLAVALVGGCQALSGLAGLTSGPGGGGAGAGGGSAVQSGTGGEGGTTVVSVGPGGGGSGGGAEGCDCVELCLTLEGGLPCGNQAGCEAVCAQAGTVSQALCDDPPSCDAFGEALFPCATNCPGDMPPCLVPSCQGNACVPVPAPQMPCGQGMACHTSGVCAPESCTDGVENGNEAQIDCGTPEFECPQCGTGTDCVVPDTCVGVCEFNPPEPFGTCQPCLGDAACQDAQFLGCSADQGRCIRCADGDACRSAGWVGCNLPLGYCQTCSLDSECAGIGRSECDAFLGRCIGQSDCDFCPPQANGQPGTCDVAQTGLCTPTTTAQCIANRYIDTAAGGTTCRLCSEETDPDAACVNLGFRGCNQGVGRCAPCTMDDHCLQIGLTTCELSTGRCS